MSLPLRAARSLVVLSVMLAANVADACWDGYAAKVGTTSVHVANETDWEPARIRHVALWMGRVNALAAGREVDASFGVVTVGDDERAWEGGYASLFDDAADMLGRSRRERTRALGTRTDVFTVQILAAKSAKRAEAVARRVNATDGAEDGFFEAGGFPAMNPKAHVVDEGALHKVLVGAFLDAEEARRVARALTAETGLEAFPRRL